VSNWTAPSDSETFAEAIGCKPAAKSHLSDLQWYVALVAQAALADDLDCGQFKFDLQQPGARITFYFSAQLPPLEAARRMFSQRH